MRTSLAKPLRSPTPCAGQPRARPHGGHRIASGPQPKLVVDDQAAHALLQQVAPPAFVVGGQRALVGGAGQVGEEDVGVGGVDDRGLGRSGEDLLRVGHEPLVELVVAGDQHGDRLLALAPGPAGLLPQRGDGAGEAVQHAGVQPADVDAQLQRRGGHDGPQPTVEQVGLDLPPLGRQVAAPVGGHGRPQLSGEAALDLGGHHLGTPAAAAEGDGPVTLPHEAGDHVGRLAVGRPLRAARLPPVVMIGGRHLGVVHRGQVDVHLVVGGGVPEGEQALTLRRGVVRHLLDGQAAELGGQAPGLADGRRAEDEGRVGAVEVADPPQAPEQVGDVGAEDAPQDVQLVDDHVLQPGQVRGPLCVVGEQRRMQHLRVGEQDGGLGPGPRPLLGRAVPVVGGGHQAGQVQLEQGPGLVLGQRLGREDAQRGAGPHGCHGRFGDRGLVAEGLARRRARGQDHRPSRPDGVDGLGLVRPQPFDAQPLPHEIGQRLRQLAESGGTGRQALEVDQTATRDEVGQLGRHDRGHRRERHVAMLRVPVT